MSKIFFYTLNLIVLGYCRKSSNMIQNENIFVSGVMVPMIPIKSAMFTAAQNPIGWSKSEGKFDGTNFKYRIYFL